MKTLMVFLVLLLLPLTAIAGEKVKGTTYFVVDQQGWQTGEGTGYWIWHGNGISQSVEGPLGTVPSECHGAGFWDENGSWGEGICIHGDGDDTRTVHWKRDKGQKVGQWTNVLGTGKFAGMTGGGAHILQRVCPAIAKSANGMARSLWQSKPNSPRPLLMWCNASTTGIAMTGIGYKATK